MNLNFSCQAPTHDWKHRGIWHTWTDEKGLRWAVRCNASLEAEKLDAEAARESRKVVSTSWLRD